MILLSNNSKMAIGALNRLQGLTQATEHHIVAGTIVSGTETPQMEEHMVFVDFFTTAGKVSKERVCLLVLASVMDREEKEEIRRAIMEAERVTIWKEGDRLLRISTSNPEGHQYGGSVFTMAIFDDD